MRPLLTLWLLLFALGARPAAAQSGASLRVKLLQAEDRRAPSEADLLLLKGSLRHPDTTVALQAIRALGRLERPSVAASLLPLLAHASGRIRAVAADAVAQAAQGFRGDSSASHRGAAWGEIVAALSARAGLERDPDVVGALALSLGRLPYLTAEEIGSARKQLVALSRTTREDRRAARSVARGLETLVRATWRRIPPDTGLVMLLRALAAGAAEEPVRRHALGALLAAQAADSGTIAGMLGSSDPQSRRLAATGFAAIPPGAARDRLLDAALVDPAAMVRIEALRAVARQKEAAWCPRLAAAAEDPASAVSLLAIDLLAGCGSDSVAVARLAQMASAPSDTWHRPAHALVSLARAAPERARDALPRFSAQEPWQARMYAARAAAVLRDAEALLRLAADRAANVREAAIAGLAAVSGHAADSVYRAALGATDGQLLIGAATALAGSPARAEAATALLGALARSTRERRETSRDARVALLTRLHQLGGPPSAPALLPYLRDFDPVIAESAAVLLTGWTGRPHHAAPRRLPIVVVSANEADALRGMVFRITLASGVVEVEPDLDAAPLTTVRLARLVRRGYFDGLTLHRVVPNFVLQGGSPGANEYAGDGPFLRDELGPGPHDRGTLGVSTRGRDTGDGQIFVNLVDNPRLDFEYTVWGRVVAGMELLDAAREGEVMRRVEIRPR
jgi:cyclophilin family peptidyl-prolyl cis-trans isomerase/HEAT repeat protein